MIRSVDDYTLQILANISECITVIDSRGIILYANPPFLRLFHIRGNNFSGEHIKDFITGGDIKKLLRILSAPAGSHKSHYTIEMRGKKRDFSEFPFSCRVTTLPLEGDTDFLLGITDLTPSIETNARIEQLQNLASIGTFASGVVHEFNNLLTGIRGYAQLASPDLMNKNLLEKAFAIIEAECQRGSELCKNMSLYSSRSQINPEAVSLKMLAETVLSLQKRFFLQENISVVQDISEIPPVMVDKFQIQQVLLNLIINARHALIPKGGGIITLRIREQKSCIVIEVEDNGIGIDSQNISRIFDPFFTSKGPIGVNRSGREIKGSGLGLAVSHSIVKKHKGTITVISEPGSGSCFTVQLPKFFAEPKQPAEKKADHLHQIISRKPLKVLVVDDEPSIRELLFKALTAISMDVMLARNAEEAMSLCKSDRFDIVFLDYILPEMNGDHLIPIIKEYLPQTKIVMISGWTSSPVKKKTIEKNVHAWIDKPFDITQIFNCIRELAADEAVKH
jgi:PAS domain S-box-containing protein